MFKEKSGSCLHWPTLRTRAYQAARVCAGDPGVSSSGVYSSRKRKSPAWMLTGRGNKLNSYCTQPPSSSTYRMRTTGDRVGIGMTRRHKEPTAGTRECGMRYGATNLLLRRTTMGGDGWTRD